MTRQRNARWTASSIGDQSGRTAVITGANTGIGFEVARALAERGATVVLAARDQAQRLLWAESERLTGVHYTSTEPTSGELTSTELTSTELTSGEGPQTAG